MSLYREPGRIAARRVAMAAAAALVIGLLGGFLIGRATKSEPSLSDQVSTLRDDLRPAREGLTLAPNEYAQGVKNGSVVAPTEYGAAKADVSRAAAAIAAHKADLEALGAERARALDAAITTLQTAINQKADPSEITRLSKAAQTAQTAATGP